MHVNKDAICQKINILASKLSCPIHQIMSYCLSERYLVFAGTKQVPNDNNDESTSQPHISQCMPVVLHYDFMSGCELQMRKQHLLLTGSDHSTRCTFQMADQRINPNQSIFRAHDSTASAKFVQSRMSFHYDLNTYFFQIAQSSYSLPRHLFYFVEIITLL